jgi:hypothetical protein
MKRLLEKADRGKCLDLEDYGSVFLARSREITVNAADCLSPFSTLVTRASALAPAT